MLRKCVYFTFKHMFSIDLLPEVADEIVIGDDEYSVKSKSA